jgi:hypothetical protein
MKSKLIAAGSDAFSVNPGLNWNSWANFKLSGFGVQGPFAGLLQYAIASTMLKSAGIVPAGSKFALDTSEVVTGAS